MWTSLAQRKCANSFAPTLLKHQFHLQLSQPHSPLLSVNNNETIQQPRVASIKITSWCEKNSMSNPTTVQTNISCRSNLQSKSEGEWKSAVCRPKEKAMWIAPWWVCCESMSDVESHCGWGSLRSCTLSLAIRPQHHERSHMSRERLHWWCPLQNMQRV